MTALVVALATVELGWIIVKDIFAPPLFLLDINELLEIFGLFFLVLIGIELLDTIKTYLAERTLHVEVVLVVAMIAIACKVIILDTEKLSALTLLGIGAIILALTIGYYLVKQSQKSPTGLEVPLRRGKRPDANRPPIFQPYFPRNRGGAGRPASG